LWDEDVAVFSRWYEPDASVEERPLLFCIPGGTYNHRYWDLDVPGASYSFAGEMTGRGYSVVAIDNLGTGASTRPRQGSGLSELALAASLVVEFVRKERSPRAVVGVGHSMGGYALVTQQAQARSFDAVAILGSVIGPSTLFPVPDEVIASAREGHDARM